MIHPFVSGGYGLKPRPPGQETVARYRVSYPNGTSARVRTTNAIQPNALAICYEADGRWRNNGVYDTVPYWVGRPRPDGSAYVLLQAERIG